LPTKQNKVKEMPNYRRALVKGGTYFFTVVTYRQREILTLPESRSALRSIIVKTAVSHKTYEITQNEWSERLSYTESGRSPINNYHLVNEE